MDRAETQQREEPHRTSKKPSGSVSPEPGKGLAGHRLRKRARKTVRSARKLPRDAPAKLDGDTGHSHEPPGVTRP